MKALVLLQLNSVQTSTANAATTSVTKPEVILARAGFPHKEIADMLGKSQAAVAKAISRSKTKDVDDSGPEAEGLADA